MLHDLLAGRTPDDALAKEWRRGVLPPGRLGWRLARSCSTRRSRSPSRPTPCARAVTHRGARRLLRPRGSGACSRHRHRPLRRAPRARQLLPRSGPSTGSTPGSRCSRCARRARRVAFPPAWSAAARRGARRARRPGRPRGLGAGGRGARPAARPGRDLRRRDDRAAPAAGSRPGFAWADKRRSPRPPGARRRSTEWKSDRLPRRARRRRARARLGPPPPPGPAARAAAARRRGVATARTPGWARWPAGSGADARAGCTR